MTETENNLKDLEEMYKTGGIEKEAYELQKKQLEEELASGMGQAGGQFSSESPPVGNSAPAQPQTRIRVSVGGREDALEREEVIKRVMAGKIRRGTKVMRYGMDDWVEAGELPELEDYFIRREEEEAEIRRAQQEAARLKKEAEEAAERKVQQEAERRKKKEEAERAAKAEAERQRAWQEAERQRRIRQEAERLREEKETKKRRVKQKVFTILKIIFIWPFYAIFFAIRWFFLLIIRAPVIVKLLIILVILGGVVFFVEKSYFPNIFNLFRKSEVNQTANDDSDVTATVTENVNFRNGPSTGNEIIRELNRGETVTLTGEISDGWTQVTHNGDTGWVSSSYIKLLGKSAASQTATITINVNFRRGPSIDNEIIRELQRGNTVTLTGETSGGWTQVTHNGDTGWVSSEYINISETTQTAP